ncbi:Low molecular weight phosphotyrosine protein phosphatase [Rhodotorula kratochvilovae]
MLNRPARLLCLHGYAQNARVLAGKLAQAERVFDGHIELVYVNAPNILLRPTFAYDNSPDEPYAPENEPRSFWHSISNDGFTDPSELDRTLYYLRDVLETHGPFDGIFGFSQGAATAAILCALVARPWLHPAFSSAPSTGAAWPPLPFKFAIFCSGYLPLDKRCESWFEHPVGIPALHVVGRSDVVAPNERTLANVSRFSNSRVEWHEGGHYVPRKPYFAHLFKDFILSHTFPVVEPPLFPLFASPAGFTRGGSGFEPTRASDSPLPSEDPLLRSPVTVLPMSPALRAKKRGYNIEVDSAGTAGYHVGEEPDERSVETCKKHGKADFTRFDYIVGMDSMNMRNIEKAKPKNATAKIALFGSFGDGKVIEDPYYGGPGGFEKTYQQCVQYSEGLLRDMGFEEEKGGKL